jgi:hypothetical protein
MWLGSIAHLVVCFDSYKMEAGGSSPENYTSRTDSILAVHTAASCQVSFTVYSVLYNTVALWRTGDKWICQVNGHDQTFSGRNRFHYVNDSKSEHIGWTFTKHSYFSMGKITPLFHFSLCTWENWGKEWLYTLLMIIKWVSGKAKMWNHIVCSQNLELSAYYIKTPVFFLHPNKRKRTKMTMFMSYMIRETFWYSIGFITQV